MKLAIFTGIHNGKRFFDHYLNDDIEASEKDYIKDARFDYELSETEIFKRIGDLLSDFESFWACSKGLSRSDIIRFIHRAFRADFERELISEHVEGNARKMVVELWKQDCLIDLKRKYKDIE